MIICYDRATLSDVVSNSLAAALRLEADFADICKDDPLINYETPTFVGIGLSRGTATCLSSGGKTLDYSGRPLNLASRLMDLARPHGVVVDEALFAGLDTTQWDPTFIKGKAYVKGIADLLPLEIRSTNSVKIPSSNLHPIGGEQYVSTSELLKFSEFKARGPVFMFSLARLPLDDESIQLHYTYEFANARGQKVKGMMRQGATKAMEVRKSGKTAQAVVDLTPSIKLMEAAGTKSTWLVRLWLTYTVPLAEDNEVQTVESNIKESG